MITEKKNYCDVDGNRYKCSDCRNHKKCTTASSINGANCCWSFEQASAEADNPVTVRHAGKSRTFKNMDEMWKEEFGMSDEFVAAGKVEYEQARAEEKNQMKIEKKNYCDEEDVAWERTLRKWHPSNPSQGDGECGLCTFYEICDKCPINELDTRCDGINHPHLWWAAS